MANITIQDAQSWAEGTKLTLDLLDSGLQSQVASQVLSRISTAYDTTGWVNPTATPALVRSIIAMVYIAWLYQRTYSEDEPGSNWYADRLLAMSEDLIVGIINGTIDITDVVTPTLQGSSPSYYPSDASSSLLPSYEDPSLGPARFSMGQIF